MGFEEQNDEGFRLGMAKAIDLFFGLSSILVRIGERFAQGEQQINPGSIGVPGLARLASGYAKAGGKNTPVAPGCGI